MGPPTAAAGCLFWGFPLFLSHGEKYTLKKNQKFTDDHPKLHSLPSPVICTPALLGGLPAALSGLQV